VRQGFVAVVTRPDGSTLVATSPRWEQSGLYSLVEDRLYVAHHPRDLIRALPRPPALDVAKLIDLAVHYDDPAVTVFDGIARVPNGHVLAHRPGRPVEVRRWFEPDLEEDRSISLAEAPRLLREAVLDAVRVSLPDDGQVTATLSGGLDSSTVAATAARLLAPDGRTVEAFTHVPIPGTEDPSGPWDADDGPYADLISRSVGGLAWSPVANTALTTPLEADRWAMERTWQPAFNPLNQVWFNEIVRRCEALGSPLLLTGGAGNATFSRNYDGILRGLARRARVDALLRQVRLRHAAGAGWGRAARSVVRETLPARVLAWRREQRHRRSGVHREWAGMFETLPARVERLSEPARADYERSRAGLGTMDRAGWIDFVRLDGARFGLAQDMSPTVWWSDPLSDPEVVATAFRMPEEAWLAGGRDRGLAREAALGVLPDVVRLRETWGAQSADGPAWMVGQVPAYQELLERFRSSPTVPEFLDLELLSSVVGPPLTDPGTAVIWQDIYGRAFSLGHFAVWYEDEILG
jgi:asparagine synthase (glutamine-hydrolysing)